MEGKLYYSYLFKKHLEGTASQEEVDELKASWQQETDRTLWEAIVTEHFASSEPDKAYDSSKWESMVDAILAGRPQRSTQWRIPLFRWAAAAVLLVAILGGIAYLYKGQSVPGKDLVQTESFNVDPGKDGAILTLADGKQVLLDTIKNGVVALQGGATARVVNGKLVYETEGTEVVYNTMSTPRGRQYNLVLPDGTGVWLNSGSSITFPVVFTGGERKVTVTGEVYFEVAHDAQRPFYVSKGTMQVLVLGTHFNVNAYDDEKDISVTLLQGSVKVIGSGGSVTIKPSQQARIDQASIKVYPSVDVEKVVAWKNGFFNFNDVGLYEVMRQLERWYDIKVVYGKGLTDMQFGGKINKQASLNDVLEILKKAGVKFTYGADHTLVVQP